MTTVVIPWRGGDPQREANLEWTVARFERLGWPVVLGESPEGPFNRAAAILDGAARTDADVVVVSDGDCWTDALPVMVSCVENGAPWALPNLRLWRLDERSSLAVLEGATPDESMGLAQKPYAVFECGIAVVLRRDVLFDVPPDPRFVGWGGEERAWSAALRTLAGPPARVEWGGWPIWHLWHEPQPRKSRSVGNQSNESLVSRYKRARKNPDAMRALIDESREVTV